MGFFKNKTFNLIYVHGAFQAFAAYGGESFAFVYMLKAGIPVPIVLCAIGLLFGRWQSGLDCAMLWFAASYSKA
jgi:hypothetical protein